MTPEEAEQKYLEVEQYLDSGLENQVITPVEEIQLLVKLGDLWWLLSDEAQLNANEIETLQSNACAEDSDVLSTVAKYDRLWFF